MQTTPVVEREAELATFSRAIRRAAAGRGAVLAVTGAAGVGKTCLLEQVESEAATAGWFVLSDRAPRSRARRSILLELLEGLDPGKHPLDGPARALRALASGHDVPTADLVGGMRWLLEDLVAERQVLLVVDDLPRGDLASVRALHALRDEIRSLGCLLVFSVSDDEPGAELAPGVADLVAALVADARRLAPALLTRDSVGALARVLRPAVTDEEIADLHRRSAGNPRAVHDLLHLRRAPRRPEDEVRRALAALDPAATDLLRLACLADDPPQLTELAAALDLPEPEVRRRCRDLGAERLLTVDLDQAAPATTPVRLAVLAAMSRTDAADLHDRLAQALLIAGARADRLVTHLLHARPRGNPAARVVLEHQGRRALRDGDTRLGVALLRRALDEGPRTTDDAALASALARGLVTLGDVTGAVACWRQAGDLCDDPDLAREYAAAAADALADAGRHSEAVAVYAALVADAPPETRRWVHDRMLLASYVSGLEPLDRPDDDGGPQSDTASISTAFALANKSLAADRVAALALVAARDALEGRLPIRSLLLATALLTAASAFEGADRLLSDAVAAPRDPQTGVIAGACRGLVLMRTGRITEALADLDRAGAHQAAAEPMQEVARLTAVVDGLLARGDLSAATRLSVGLGRMPLSTGIAAAMARHTLAEVAAATGDHARASELYVDAGHRTGAEVDNPGLLPWRVGAALSEIRSGSAGRALELARENLRLARQFGAAYAEAQALRTVAVIDVTADRVGLLRQSLDVVGTVPAVRLRAQIQTDLAALLALTPAHATEAVVLLRGVEAYAGSEGLEPLRARARRLLDRLGVPGPRGPADALTTLTAGERRTARLAADGHSNQAIAERLGVGVKAVEWHLSGCYRKLGIRSRRQLAAALTAA